MFACHRLNPDVFVPELGTLADEIAHELDARGVLQDFETHAVGAHGFFATEERFVLADDDGRDAVEDDCSRLPDSRVVDRVRL